MKITKIKVGETIKVGKDWKTFEAQAEPTDEDPDISVKKLKEWVAKKVRE